MKKSSPRQRIKALAEVLAAVIPAPRCALNFRNPFELVTATILSAQCTDSKVNLVTPALFAAFPTPEKMALAARREVEARIHSLGLFRSKAANIIKMAQMVVDKFSGQIPRTIPELVRLPGVGRKTANCVLVNAYKLPGIMVDTHCLRLTARWQLTTETAPDKVEMALKKLLPESAWSAFSERVILFGRGTCTARRPQCANCPVRERKLCDFVYSANGEKL